MTKTLLLIVIACTGAILVLPKATADRKKALDDYMMEDKKTHTRHNYLVQRGRRMDPIGPPYERRSFEPESSEDLPALIVDYANMIRNDIILLDNSVETRTRKRGNVKKYNHAISDPPCTCESFKEIIDLGSNHYPQYVESRNCSKGSCPPPYQCKEKYYHIIVLKARTSREEDIDEDSQTEMPDELYSRWVAKQINVTTGCVCARGSDVN